MSSLCLGRYCHPSHEKHPHTERNICWVLFYCIRICDIVLLGEQLLLLQDCLKGKRNACKFYVGLSIFVEMAKSKDFAPCLTKHVCMTLWMGADGALCVCNFCNSRKLMVSFVPQVYYSRGGGGRGPDTYFIEGRVDPRCILDALEEEKTFPWESNQNFSVAQPVTWEPGYCSRYSDWLRAGRSGDRIPVRVEIFRTRPDRPCAPPNFLYNGYRVFPGGKATEAWRWPPTPPPSSAEVKERVELYLYSPSGSSWPVLRWNLPLPLSLQALNLATAVLRHFYSMYVYLLIFVIYLVTSPVLLYTEH